MVPPMASARNRQTVRPRAPRELQRMRARRRRPERHAARFVLTALFSAVLLLTLLLTAFGTWSADPVATSPLAEANVLPGGQPLPQIVATVGTRAAAAACRADGRDRDRLSPGGQRLAGARPGRPPGQRRPLRAHLAPPRGSEGEPARLVPAPRRPRPRHVGARGRRRARHRRLRARRRHGRRNHRLRALEPHVRRPDRHPAAYRAFGRRLAHTPARRPGVDRRLRRHESALQDGRRRRPDQQSSARHSPATRRTRATTCRCRCVLPPCSRFAEASSS